MRSKSLIAGTLCLLSMTLLLALSGRSQKPEEQPKFEIIEIGTGGSPKWSPDGTRLAFLAGGWLSVAEADGKGDIKKVAEIRPYSFEWMGDSSFVMSEKRSWGEEGKAEGHILAIKTVDMKGQVQTIRRDSIVVVPRSDYLSYPSTPLVLRDGTVGYYAIQEKPEGEERIFKLIKEGSLRPEEAVRQVQLAGEGLETIDGIVKRRVPIGNTYRSLRLSPDQTKILAVLSSQTSDLVVLDLDGNELARFHVGFAEISPGVFAGGASSRAQWAPDGKRVVYTWFVESEAHPEEETSDLYIINADGTDKIQITNTPHEAEHNPVWSPDGTRIACRSESTGRIFVIKID
jgi:hypothetical protein